MITATVIAGSLAKQLNLGSIVALLVVGMTDGAVSAYDNRIAGFLIAVAHLHWQSAFIMALGLAMSSDVIAISSLEEHAESAFRTPVPTKRC